MPTAPVAQRNAPAPRSVLPVQRRVGAGAGVAWAYRPFTRAGRSARSLRAGAIPGGSAFGAFARWRERAAGSAAERRRRSNENPEGASGEWTDYVETFSEE